MLQRPYPDAMREICEKLGFEAVPDEWEWDHPQPDRIDDFIALYWKYRDDPNEWFRHLLGELILETANRAVSDRKADSVFLLKIRRFFELVASEQQQNLRDWIQIWYQEDDEHQRLLPPLLEDLVKQVDEGSS